MTESTKVTKDTINMTPTWVDVLPYLITAVAYGGMEGKAIAKEELLRMAKAADHANSIKPTIKTILKEWSVPQKDIDDVLGSSTMKELLEAIWHNGYSAGASIAALEES